jgi:hypothetical protein
LHVAYPGTSLPTVGESVGTVPVTLHEPSAPAFVFPPPGAITWTTAPGAHPDAEYVICCPSDASVGSATKLSGS